VLALVLNIEDEVTLLHLVYYFSRGLAVASIARDEHLMLKNLNHLAIVYILVQEDLSEIIYPCMIYSLI